MKKSEKAAVAVGAVILVPTICLIGLILYTSISGKEIKLDLAKRGQNAGAQGSASAGADAENGGADETVEGAAQGDGTAGADAQSDLSADIYGAENPPPEDESPAVGIDPGIYDRLSAGMSYDETAVLLGMEGIDITGGGIPGTAVYQWFSSDGSGNIMVAFLDGKSVGKARTGTADLAAGGLIDKDIYHRLTAGMSYDEAAAATGGPGILLAGPDALGPDASLYAWTASDGVTSAVVSFKDGKISEKTQFGLE